MTDPSDYRLPCYLTSAVEAERRRQLRIWGDQQHPLARWVVILAEELGEVALATLEEKTEDARLELLQLAAVAIAAVESIDAPHRQ